MTSLRAVLPSRARAAADYVIITSAIVLGAVAMPACTTPPASGAPPIPIAAELGAAESIASVQWLGVSSWIISRGRDVVVIDPFFSRPSLGTVASSLLLGSLGPSFDYDEARIRAVLPTLPPTTAFMLIGHAHYDHLMDVPYYMRTATREVTYVGGPTAENILRGFGTALKFQVLRQGEFIRTDTVRVTAFSAGHAPHFAGITLMDGEVETPRSSPPRSARDYKLGETLVYVIDFMTGETVDWRVFISGAASAPPTLRTDAERRFFDARPADVAILCVPGWNLVEDYPAGMLRLVKPRRVVPSHFDDFFSPYHHGEDPKAGMKFLWRAAYPGFIERLELSQGQYGYTIHEPRTGECLAFPGREPKLGCQR